MMFRWEMAFYAQRVAEFGIGIPGKGSCSAIQAVTMRRPVTD